MAFLWENPILGDEVSHGAQKGKDGMLCKSIIWKEEDDCIL